MNDKEKLRQQLLEQTLGRHAKNRRIGDSIQDLETIFKFQQESIEELSQGVSQEKIDEINREIEKDFGIRLKSQNQPLDTSSLDQIEDDLKKKWHYDDMIHHFISTIRKSYLMDKKEYSFLFYQVKGKDIKNILTDCAYYFHQQDISYLSFLDYSNEIHIFYQDMYNCLYSQNQFIVIDYLECLPVAFMQSLLSLLKNKEMILNKRYIEIEGSLKEVNNQLVNNVVSSLKWENKYIIFLTHESIDRLTDRFGSVFIKMIDECIEYQALNQDDYCQMMLQQYHQFKKRVESRLAIEMKDDQIYQYLIHEHHIEDVDCFLEDVFEKIIDLKDRYQLSSIEFIYKDHQLYLKLDDQEIKLFQNEDQSFENIDQQLQELVGLQEVKDYLQSLKQYYATIQKRKQQGKKVMEVSKHMIFTGRAGTGKTTVARILAQYLKSAGILKSGHLIEVSRKDLVGQYVGHTAIQTSQVIASSIGGVLFIDEAYSLYRGKDDSFGLEAIDTLVKAMEDKRDEFVVILAGYKKEMEQFLQSNSGLRSRFANIIEFKDYTGQELYKIACSIAKGKEYIIDEQCEEPLISYFEQRNRIEGGNGRLARNVVEKAMIHQASRCSDDDLLILEDFELGKE